MTTLSGDQGALVIFGIVALAIVAILLGMFVKWVFKPRQTELEEMRSRMFRAWADGMTDLTYKEVTARMDALTEADVA